MWLIPPHRLKGPFEEGCVVPVMLRFDTALSAQNVYRVFHDQKPSVLLESPSFPSKNSSHRYSYVCWDPLFTIKISGSCVERETRTGSVQRFNLPPPENVTPGAQVPLIEYLRKELDRYKGCHWPGLDFFSGGAVVALGYELASHFEKLPKRHGRESETPDLMLALFDRVVVLDHMEGSVTVCKNIGLDRAVSFEQAYESAAREVQDIRKTIENGRQVSKEEAMSVKNFKSRTTPDAFYQMVRKAKSYIRAGDIYQANLSQCFDFEYEGNAFPVYEKLHAINPSPYSAYLDWGEIKLIGASPERLIQLEGDLCQTRPIAGTRPRGKDVKTDEDLRRELLLNEKERAEHLMLVDLERNDLGRVCQYGSVRVDEWMTVETYSHVHHIVSNIVGKLRQDADRFDLLRAMFPGGTITGCPKIRCMEIIHELERRDRGFYTGSVGYLDFNGNMDLNIVIRTLVLNERKGYIQVGAGIVADSDERFEFQETLHKGRALFEALECNEYSSHGHG